LDRVDALPYHLSQQHVGQPAEAIAAVGEDSKLEESDQ
jgi:hypothetical protein